MNEAAAELPGFARLHPLAPDALAQGTLQLMWELQAMLAEIGGMHATTLQPAAGAHGELTGILVIRAYHRAPGDLAQDEVIVPDSSHGTNPATASMAGFRTVTIPSAADGGVDVDALRAALGPRTAAVMLTNPSTLGLFERRITEVLEATHAAGGLAYMDGANMNAILGRFRPGAARFDVILQLPTRRSPRPHTAVVGPVPAPWPLPSTSRRTSPSRSWCARTTAASGSSGQGSDPGRSAGCAPTRAAWASWSVHTHTSGRMAVRGCDAVSEDAVLAANYLRQRVGEAWELPYPGPCKHEFVASGRRLREETGVRTLDVAKRLIDHGFHPPTIYFPLIVEECLLVEPTETETLEDLDAFAEALLAVALEAHERPELLHEAPLTTPVRRLDEATAARRPELRWRPMTGAETPCPQ
ncbi:MAG: aminomethyl-transferring glycine dehydrogenase subunit GcvPB [Chloroflexota bacterium]